MAWLLVLVMLSIFNVNSGVQAKFKLKCGCKLERNSGFGDSISDSIEDPVGGGPNKNEKDGKTASKEDEVGLSKNVLLLLGGRGSGEEAETETGNKNIAPRAMDLTSAFVPPTRNPLEWDRGRSLTAGEHLAKHKFTSKGINQAMGR